MSADPRLSEEEINRLRIVAELAPFVPQLREEAEFRAAVRLIVRVSRRGVVALAATLGAAILFRDHVLSAIKWLGKLAQ